MTEFLQPAFIVGLIVLSVRITTPILIAALGEIITERAGILNLGVEGTMMMGAFFGYIGTYKTGYLWVGLAAALLSGIVMGLIMVFISSTLKANQIVTGLSLNLLASGLSLYWYRLGVRTETLDVLPTIDTFGFSPIPVLADIPFIGAIFFSHQWLTYVAYLLVPVLWFFLYRTNPGMQLRSLGENPRAIDMKGISVPKMQYLAVMTGGMLAGLGGGYLTLVSSGSFLPGMSAGRGWLAIVVVIAGNWLPFRAMIAALLFGFLSALQLQIQALGVSFPYQILVALPYILAIVALISNSRAKAKPPLSLGIPYYRE